MDVDPGAARHLQRPRSSPAKRSATRTTHGVTVMASAADEAAEHHNQPGSLPDTIVVNAVEGPADISAESASRTPRRRTCSSTDAPTTGPESTCRFPPPPARRRRRERAPGWRVSSTRAALNACGAPLYGSCPTGTSHKLSPASDCTRVTGEPCPITANEVRQLIASGNVGGTTVDGSSQLGSNAPSSGVAAADEGEGGQADDVDTAAEPELACSVGMAPTCTDPNLNSIFAPDEYGGVDRTRCRTPSASPPAGGGTSSSAMAVSTPTRRSPRRPKAGSRPRPTSPRRNGSNR